MQVINGFPFLDGAAFAHHFRVLSGIGVLEAGGVPAAHVPGLIFREAIAEGAHDPRDPALGAFDQILAVQQGVEESRAPIAQA